MCVGVISASIDCYVGMHMSVLMLTLVFILMSMPMHTPHLQMVSKSVCVQSPLWVIPIHYSPSRITHVWDRRFRRSHIDL